MCTRGSAVPAGAPRAGCPCSLSCAPALSDNVKQSPHNPAAFYVTSPGCRKALGSGLGTSLAWGSPREDPGWALLPFPLHGPQGTSIILPLTDTSRMSTAPARLPGSAGWGLLCHPWGRQVLLHALPKGNQQWGLLLLFCFLRIKGLINGIKYCET